MELSLSKIAGRPGPERPEPTDNRDPKILEAARLFEQEFVRHMVREMRKTVPENELMPDGMGGKIWKDELDTKYVENWVNQSGGVGMADVIYDQLVQKIQDLRGHHGRATAPGEGLPLQNRKPIDLPQEKPQDILLNQQAGLFEAKPVATGDMSRTMQIRSREALEENVSLRSPFSGTVLQASALDNGDQAVVIEHAGTGPHMISTFVHNGHTKVRPGQQIYQGMPVVEFLAGQSQARAQFGLRVK